MDGLSKSFHASLLTQKRQERVGRGGEGHDSEASVREEGVGCFVQLFLVSALCGIEMCLSFEQIYELLFLQYLGVPVNLVSINGVVCGAFSMVLLPVLGILGDRGSNTKLNKMITLVVGMLAFLFGLSLLTTAGFIKLDELGDISGNNLTGFGDGITPLSADTINITPTAYDDSASDNNGAENSNLPITAFLAISGFALMDIGFDISMSLTRAFVLEVVPAFQHTRLLMMSTVAQSLAGTAFSSIGCFNFPDILGPIFHVEGVAATLIFFCSFLFCVILLGYLCTILTGTCLGHTKKRSYKCLRQENSPGKNVFPNGRKEPNARRRLDFHDDNRSYKPDILHTEEGVTVTRPILIDDSVKLYSTMSSTSIVLSSSGNLSYLLAERQRRSQAQSPESNTGPSLSEGAGGPDKTSAHAHNNVKTSKRSQKTRQQNKSRRGAHRPVMAAKSNKNESSSDDPDLSDRSTSMFSALKQSLSSSLSVVQSPLGEFHSRKLAELRRNSKQPSGAKRNLLSRRLVILCASFFFSIGASLCTVMYSSNSLTIGIYQGDPLAQEGTEGYQKYKEGLRMAAFGNLVMYASYLVTSVINQTIINIIGEHGQFIVSHCLLIVALLTLLLTQTVAVYFIYMVSCGIFRSTVYTLTFVLIHKIHHEQFDNEGSNKDVGKLMSMVGFLIPSHYMLVSAIMGPLMDWKGDVWIPLEYGTACGGLGLIIFLTLFCVKPKPPASE